MSYNLGMKTKRKCKIGMVLKKKTGQIGRCKWLSGHKCFVKGGRPGRVKKVGKSNRFRCAVLTAHRKKAKAKTCGSHQKIREGKGGRKYCVLTTRHKNLRKMSRKFSRVK